MHWWDTFLLLLCMVEGQWRYHTFKKMSNWYIVWNFGRLGNLLYFGVALRNINCRITKWRGNWSNAHYSFIMFCSPSCFLITSKFTCNICLCLHSIFIAVDVTIWLWHWGKTVDWVWEWSWLVLRLLWLKEIGYWRKLHTV